MNTLFSGHDTDGDEMIDGLELYKAIHHAKVHKDSHDHKLPEQAPPPGVPQLHFDPALESFIEGSEDLGAVGKKVFETLLLMAQNFHILIELNHLLITFKFL